MLPTKVLLRLAARLQQAWRGQNNQVQGDLQGLVHRLQAHQHTLELVTTRIAKARLHHLTLMLPQLQEELLYPLKQMQVLAGQVQQQLEASPAGVPALSLLVGEIRELETEFDPITIDWEQGFLSVATEPITLENIYLGPFAIRFHWDRLAHHREFPCFAIHALEPNPADTDERVVHPHVRNHLLCAGDAERPLHLALDQGRLADAFLLVHGVLSNYNPKSPHVALDVWHGLNCSECGHSVDSEDCCFCEGCDRDVCDDCMSSCSVCDISRCESCLTQCAVCEDKDCCSSCLKKCPQSDKTCCPNCLGACNTCGTEVADDELTDGLCSSCLTAQPVIQQEADAAGVTVPS